MARVLNNENGVHPDTREKVLEVAASVNYQRNSIGKALSTNKQAIRFAVLVHQNEFMLALWKGMQAACKELEDFGVTLSYYNNDKSDYHSQLQLLEAQLNEQISGVILKPIDHPAIKDAIERLTKKGIPVIAVNSDLEDSQRMCYIGQDIQLGGQIAGHLMGIMLQGQGNVVIFKENDDGANSFERRTNGFILELTSRYPQMHIDCVSIIEGVPENYQIAYDYIKTHPGLNGIFVAGSSHTEIAKALDSSSRKDHIKMICYDLFGETVRLVKGGIIDFVITQSPILQGELAVKTLFDYVFNRKAPADSLMYVPTRIKELHTISK